MRSPVIQETNIRSATYLLAQSVAACERCLQPTSAFSLGLWPGHERKLEEQWEFGETGTLLFYVDYLAPQAGLVVQDLSPYFHPDFSTATASKYWVNHCQHCRAILEDHDLHCEPDGAFLPATLRGAESILLVEIREEFSARVRGFSDNLPFFSALQFIA